MTISLRLPRLRKRTPAWQPKDLDAPWTGQPSEDPIEYTCPASAMDGECAGEQAYGVQFCLDREGSALTVWAFAAPAGPGPGDGYMVAYKFDYSARHGQWKATLWHGDAGLSGTYPTLAGADEGARDAKELLRTRGLAEAVDIPACYLDWDGRPWGAGS